MVGDRTIETLHSKSGHKRLWEYRMVRIKSNKIITITTKLHCSQASCALHPVTAIQQHALHSKPANFTANSTWITNLHHGSYQNTLHHVMTHITNHIHKSQLTSHSSQSHMNARKTVYIFGGTKDKTQFCYSSVTILIEFVSP